VDRSIVGEGLCHADDVVICTPLEQKRAQVEVEPDGDIAANRLALYAAKHDLVGELPFSVLQLRATGEEYG
jgi:hypothetical protein